MYSKEHREIDKLIGLGVERWVKWNVGRALIEWKTDTHRLLENSKMAIFLYSMGTSLIDWLQQCFHLLK